MMVRKPGRIGPREDELEPALASRAFGSTDGAVMCRHNAFRDGQSQTAAPASARPAFIQPDEAPEDPETVALRYGVAVVVDGEDGLAGAGVEGDPNAGAGMLVRVVQHVPQHLPKPHRVTLDPHRPEVRLNAVRAGGPQAANLILHHMVQVDVRHVDA